MLVGLFSAYLPFILLRRALKKRQKGQFAFFNEQPSNTSFAKSNCRLLACFALSATLQSKFNYFLMKFEQIVS